MAVYLLHFSAPISPAHTCQHYLGYAEDVDRRIAEHRAGTGARLTEVAKQRGITFEVVRTRIATTGACCARSAIPATSHHRPARRVTIGGQKDHL